MRLLILPILAAGLPLLAQTPEAPKQPWSDKGSLSYVAVSGNASSQSLGFSNEYRYLWSDATFAFNLGGVRVSTTTIDRSAFGASLASRLALKIGYEVTYANRPASVGVTVVRTPVTTPPVLLGQVPFQLKKTDTVFTTSLVVTF
jgi:putative salt-induced outer membrane protein YdiY